MESRRTRARTGEEGASVFEDIIVPFADNVTQEEYGEALSYSTRNSTFLP